MVYSFFAFDSMGFVWNLSPHGEMMPCLLRVRTKVLVLVAGVRSCLSIPPPPFHTAGRVKGGEHKIES